MQPFKLIVAGGRDFKDYARLSTELIKLATEIYADKSVSIVSGADGLAIQFAGIHGVKLDTFPANWDQFGKRAGFMRNTEMAHFSDGLLAFWDGQSKGTKHMIETMQKIGKPVHIAYY